MTEVIITEIPSVTYRVRFRPSYFMWADITLREWEGGGSIQIQSDYGEFAHIWSSIGCRTLIEFLCSVDMDYFMKKTRTSDYRLFSAEKTDKAIKRDIISCRKDGYITKEVAREVWDEVEWAELGNATSETEFYLKVQDVDFAGSFVNTIYDGDYAAIPHRTEYNPQCTEFWNNVWLEIVKYWKESV